MNQPVQNKKITVMAMSAILSLNIFIFSPWSLYLTNIEQFTTSLLEVMNLCLIPALILCLLFIPVFALIPVKNMHRVAALIAMFSILTWFQGNVLLWGYGPLDGQNIMWSEYVWRGWIDVTLWIAAIILVNSFYNIIGKFVVRTAIFVFIIQMLSLSYISYENRELIHKENSNKSLADPTELFKFSKNGNILHIVTDGFQSDVFDELLHHKKLKNRYQNSFQGFVFYRETLGVFPYTKFSVPAFLASEVYSNKTPKNAYIDNVLSNNTIISVADKNGYEVDIASAGGYLINRYSNLPYTNMYNLDNVKSVGVRYKDTATALDIGLFRILPHFLKKYIYNEQKWFMSQFVVSEGIYQLNYFSHTLFLNLFSQSMSVERKKPVYKYIHIMNTHNPMVVDQQCRYSAQAGVQMVRETLTNQSKCTLDTLSILFDKMRDLGVYDSTLIIVHGDHGGWVPNYRQGPPVLFSTGVEAPKWLTSLASPLLAIKKPGDNTDFRVSNIQASLLDIPATISDMMNWNANFKFQSLEKIKPGNSRKRFFRFFFYQKNAHEEDYTRPIQEFSIEGSHYEVEWKTESIFYPPNLQEE